MVEVGKIAVVVDSSFEPGFACFAQSLEEAEEFKSILSTDDEGSELDEIGAEVVMVDARTGLVVDEQLPDARVGFDKVGRDGLLGFAEMSLDVGIGGVQELADSFGDGSSSRRNAVH